MNGGERKDLGGMGVVMASICRRVHRTQGSGMAREGTFNRPSPVESTHISEHTLERGTKSFYCDLCGIISKKLLNL
jgi:hypothetical protein